MGLRSKRRALPKKKSSSATVTLKAPAGLGVEAEHEEPEGNRRPFSTENIEGQDQSVVEASVEDTAEETPSEPKSNAEPKFFWMDPAAQATLVGLKARGEERAAKLRAARAQPYVVKGFTVVNSSTPLTSEARRATTSTQWLQEELYGNRTRKRSWKVLNDRNLTDA